MTENKKCKHLSRCLDAFREETLSRATKDLQCHVCHRQPLNLWLCLTCLMLGCSDDEQGSPDHSTKHYQRHPDHPLQLNIRTKKIWCYPCVREVTQDLDTLQRPPTALAPDFDDDQKVRPNSTPGGVVGLSNLGNTCYMNAALQCLSNIPALTDYFLTCSIQTPPDQQQRRSLSLAYTQHVKRVWLKPSPARHVAPQGLLTAFKYNHPMFRGFHQQDSQEFLKYFLDQLHEELMEPVPVLNNEEDGQESPPEDEEDEEYETADSGMSEQSSSSSSSDSLSRKRQLSPEDFISSDQSSNGSQQKRHRSVSLTLKAPKTAKIQKRKPRTYKSVVSDIFDGKLVSTVQCLTCNRVSTTTETFQDLSLPIPTLDSIQNATARNQRLLSSSSLASSLNPGSMTSLNLAAAGGDSSAAAAAAVGSSTWLGWMWGWLSSWFYGPNITLHDCLAYFFSADELKGENMYSCEKCKKLRNGLKYSRVTVLPDTLCIHLKRFRHDFSFSSKISSKVTFPLVDLDMSPWLHQDCLSKETVYDLTGIVCHHGTAGGGHYTAYALNPENQEWYEFDDSYVTKVEPSVVMNAEAYVLFYRKNNAKMEDIRSEVQEVLRQSQDSSLVPHYISRQWLNKFENFAEPGPIDNSDFLCRHGGVLPTKSASVSELCAEFPRAAWELLHGEFGSVHLGLTAPAACTRLYPCLTCKAELDALNYQKSYELEEFKRLHQEFQTSANDVLYCVAMSWFKLWEAFVTGKARDPPGEIDNRAIISTVTNRNPITGAVVSLQVLRPNSDHLRVSHAIWTLYRSIYGGGPEVILKPNGVSIVIPTANTEEADKDSKSNSLRIRSVSES